MLLVFRPASWCPACHLSRPEKRDDYIAKFGQLNQSRIRVYDQDGEKILDSFAGREPTYVFRDPESEPWPKIAARWIDVLFDFLVGAAKLERFVEPVEDIPSAWPEIRAASPSIAASKVRFAPDLTHMISAASTAKDMSFSVLTTANERDIRLFVRAERFNVGMFFLFALGIGFLLSIFLARTIVRPLRHLARAAVKVRLGRAQEVTVPRLPSRRDEIGMLARALSDMSIALRQRIDATEAFAADVAHELKIR